MRDVMLCYIMSWMSWITLALFPGLLKGLETRLSNPRIFGTTPYIYVHLFLQVELHTSCPPHTMAKGYFQLVPSHPPTHCYCLIPPTCTCIPGYLVRSDNKCSRYYGREWTTGKDPKCPGTLSRMRCIYIYT